MKGFSPETNTGNVRPASEQHAILDLNNGLHVFFLFSL